MKRVPKRPKIVRQWLLLRLLPALFVLPFVFAGLAAIFAVDQASTVFAVSAIMSTIAFGLVAVLISRFSSHVSRLTENIDALALGLHKKYAAYQSDQPETEEVDPVDELAALEKSVDRLKSRLEIASKIDSAIEIERERAQTASKMASLGELVAGISHEINNPVTVIYALSDELRRKADSLKSEDIKKTAVRISKTAERISSIVKTLLRFSRNVADDPKMPHSVRDLIDDSLVLVRDQFRQANIFLEVDPIDPSIFVHCRPVQISQAMLNLMNNAADALEFSSVRWIRIQVKRVASAVVISVTDSGPGIPSSIRPRLMQPFVTTKAPGRGTGLGLSLSKQMIEEHDGILFVDWKSEATRFVIQLPIVPLQTSLDMRNDN